MSLINPLELRDITQQEAMYQRQYISFVHLPAQIGQINRLIAYHWAPLRMAEGKIEDHLVCNADRMWLRSEENGERVPAELWNPTRDHLRTAIDLFDRPRPDQRMFMRCQHLHRLTVAIDGMVTYDNQSDLQGALRYLADLRLGAVACYGLMAADSTVMHLGQPLMAVERIEYVGSMDYGIPYMGI